MGGGNKIKSVAVIGAGAAGNKSINQSINSGHKHEA
jgi:cell division GTPase FtsZ